MVGAVREPPLQMGNDTSRDKQIMITNKKHRFFLTHWLPVIIYCAAIFIQSSFPAPESIPKIIFMDKILHAIAYAILGALFFRALQIHDIKNRTLLVGISILSAALYGVSDEIHQYFVPSRDADLLDICADTIGSVFGVLVYQLFSSKQKNIHMGA